MLLAVEDASGEEDGGDAECELGMNPIVVTQAYTCVDDPRCTAREPYPEGLSHRPELTVELSGAEGKATKGSLFPGIVLHW